MSFDKLAFIKLDFDIETMVARFFLTQYTKTVYVKYTKLSQHYKMTTKYTKWP
jgi:hypothetical protein